jgi:hypothetical protein
MKQSQRTPALFGLFAASLIACSGGSDTGGTSSGKTLSISAKANGVALTVFVSAKNGDVIDSKTASPGSEQTFTFTNLPSDATMTSAFETSYLRYDPTTKQNISTPVRELTTYPISEANNFGFASPTLTNNRVTLYAKFTGKPDLPDFTYVNVLGIQTSFAFDGTNYYLNLKPTVSRNYDLQKDGNYTPIFFAFNSKNEPVGYVAYPDKTLPASENSFNTPDFLVSPSDWKTDFKTLSVNFTNTRSAEGYNLDIYADRKEAGRFLYTSTRTQGGDTATLSTKYPPGIFEKYEYYAGKNTSQDTQLGRPSQYSVVSRKGLSSLPESPTIPTLNAQTDFLAGPTNLKYAEANRPTVTWDYTPPSSVTGMYASIFDQVDEADQYWFFGLLSASSKSLIVPTLPANLSSFEPKGNGLKYRVRVAATEQTSGTNSQGYRYAGASRNFADDVGQASLRSQSRRPEYLESRGEGFPGKLEVK